MKFLILITARANSKRLKNKNLLKLNNKSLLYWSINHAKKIQENKKIIVSTDSKKILNIANKYGVSTKWLRPKKLAQSNSTSESVVKHAFLMEKKNGFIADAIIILQPTSPFRGTKLIKKAIDTFKKNPSFPLISVAKLRHSNKMLKLSKNKISLFINKKKIFMPNGSIFIINSKQALIAKNYLNKKMNFVVFKGVKENLDIDTEQDLLLSRSLYKVNI